MFNNPSFEEASRIDQLIYQLAAYEISNGYIMIPKEMDDSYDYINKVSNKFNYFKRLIRNGEMTIQELSNMVTKKNGPYFIKKSTVEEDIEKMTSENSEKEICNSEYKDGGLIQEIFRNLIKSNGDGNGNLRIVSFDQKAFDEFDSGNIPIEKPEKPEKKKNKKKGNNSGKTNKTNDQNTKKSQ